MAARLMPCLEEEDPNPFPHSDALAAIRSWVELLTDSNPYTQIDWATYQNFHQYSQRDDFRPVIQEVLKRRLGLGKPYCDKALVLCQVFSLEHLTPLGDAIKPLAEPEKDKPPTHINAIAGTMMKQITEAAESAKAAAEEADKKAKWQAWCDTYGYPIAPFQMPPPPKEMEWGMWGLMWVDPEDWWGKKEDK